MESVFFFFFLYSRAHFLGVSKPVKNTERKISISFKNVYLMCRDLCGYVGGGTTYLNLFDYKVVLTNKSLAFEHLLSVKELASNQT